MLLTTEEIIDGMKDVIDIGVDIDGTLTKEKIDKEMFSLSPKEVEKRMINLTPKNGIDILLDTTHKIYLVTGRQEQYRYVTIDWLDMYGVPYIDLTMFPNDFYVRNGYDIPKYVGLKLDIHIRKNLSLSLDDNEQVVNMFNKFGIPTCKVEDNFRHAFERVLQLRNDYKDKDNTKVISKSKDNRRSR